MWHQPGVGKRIKLFKRIFFSGIVTLLTAPRLFFIIKQVMAARLEKMIAGTDQSTIARLVIPPYLTWHVLSQDPLFGMGLGGKNAIVDTTLGVVLGLHLDVRELILFGGIKELFPIPVLEYWATFGLLGGALILYYLRKLQLMLAPHDGVPILVAIIFMSLTLATSAGLISGPSVHFYPP